MAVASNDSGGGGEARLPIQERIGPIRWLRENLFSTWYNVVLSIVALYIIYLFTALIWQWGIVDAVWVAENRRECLNINPDGACWAGVFVWFKAIIYGRYPEAEHWRIDLAVVLLALWMVPLWLPRVKAKTLVALGTVAFYPFLAAYLFMGGEKGLFLQVMLSASIVVLVANTLHALLGVLADRSLPEALISLLGLGALSEKMQRNILLAILAAGFFVVYLLQMGWTLQNVS